MYSEKNGWQPSRKHLPVVRNILDFCIFLHIFTIPNFQCGLGFGSFQKFRFFLHRGMEAPGGPIRDADDKPMEPGPTICIKAG